MTSLPDHAAIGPEESGLDDGTITIVRQVLREQLAIVRHEAASVSRPDAVESVHDFRVAMRRARVALKVYRPYLPREARGLRDDLARLADVTGPVRDLDVLAERVRRERVGTPGAAARSQALLRLLDDHRETARILLENRLARPRFARTMTAWSELSSEYQGLDPATLEQAIPAFVSVTLREARAVFDRLAAASAAFDGHTDDDRIHALRIEAKRLRYLLEFVSSVAPSARVHDVIAGLKRLQDRLGTYQDLRVQATRLRDLAAIPDAPLEARLEAVRLGARWESRRLRSRAGVGWALRRFTGAATRRLLRSIGT